MLWLFNKYIDSFSFTQYIEIIDKFNTDDYYQTIIYNFDNPSNNFHKYNELFHKTIKNIIPNEYIFTIYKINDLICFYNESNGEQYIYKIKSQLSPNFKINNFVSFDFEYIPIKHTFFPIIDINSYDLAIKMKYSIYKFSNDLLYIIEENITPPTTYNNIPNIPTIKKYWINAISNTFNLSFYLSN